MDFVDSRGLFGCRIPKNFLRAERPKDKRGTVFVAGDYSKAEVMSVQVVTAFDLLTDAGEKRGLYVLTITERTVARADVHVEKRTAGIRSVCRGRPHTR